MFSSQVLHLMNKMNLPCPFGPVTAPPPMVSCWYTHLWTFVFLIVWKIRTTKGAKKTRYGFANKRTTWITSELKVDLSTDALLFTDSSIKALRWYWWTAGLFKNNLLICAFSVWDAPRPIAAHAPTLPSREPPSSWARGGGVGKRRRIGVWERRWWRQREVDKCYAFKNG